MKPVWKWILGIFAGLLLILTAGVWYLSIHWKPIVSEKIKKAIQSSTDSLYSVSFKDLDINLFLGNVTVVDLKLTPDTQVYRQLETIKKAPDNLFSVDVNQLKIRRFNIRSILMNDELYLRNIILDTPTVHIVNSYHAYNDTVSTVPHKSLYQKIKEIVKKVEVKNIELNNVNLKYTQKQKKSHRDFTVSKVNLKIGDVLIDSTSTDDKTRFFHTKMVDVSIPGFVYHTPDSLYKINFDKVKINTQDKNILVTKFAYEPRVSKSEFYKRTGKSGSYMVLKTDTLRLNQVDFFKLWRDKRIFARKTQLKNGSVFVYSDKRYPSPPKNLIGKSPQFALLKLKTKINLDTVILDDLGVAYSEFSADYLKQGTVTFDHVYGTMTNVTNDSTLLHKNKHLKIDLSTMFMNTGKLLVNFDFNMLSKAGDFNVTASLGQMDGLVLNKIIRPLVNVEIKTANIRGLKFNMDVSEYRSKGTMHLDYDNLKINILQKQEPGEEQKKKGFLSFIANEVFLNSSNPDVKGDYIVSHFTHRRVPTHPFFKNLWKSLLAGIKECAGLSPEREAKLTKNVEKAEKVVSSVNKAKSFISNLFSKDENKDQKDKKSK